MTGRNFVFGSILASGLIASGVLIAQGHVNEQHRHPNLMAAQRLTGQAYDKIVDAQQANEWDMQGHARKAKDLLDQANRELSAAADAATENRH